MTRGPLPHRSRFRRLVTGSVLRRKGAEDGADAAPLDQATRAGRPAPRCPQPGAFSGSAPRTRYASPCPPAARLAATMPVVAGSNKVPRARAMASRSLRSGGARSRNLTRHSISRRGPRVARCAARGFGERVRGAFVLRRRSCPRLRDRTDRQVIWWMTRPAAPPALIVRL